MYLPQQAHRGGVDRSHARTSSGWLFVRPATASRSLANWLTRPDEIIGYRYRRSAWGTGIATEAATLLVQIALADPATTAIVAHALAGNRGSLRVLEKLGLRRVGELVLTDTSEPTVKLARAK